MHFWTIFFCRTEYTGSVRKLERQIEEEYIQHLRYFICRSLFHDYSSSRSLSSVTDSSLIVSGTAASGRNPTRRICSGRRGTNQMRIRRKKCQLHFCSGTAATITCWTRPTITPLPGEWLNIPHLNRAKLHLSLIFSVHLSSCDPQLDKILCVCSCGTLEKIYASAA